jgi:fructose-bisphosphate aldolase class II
MQTAIEIIKDAESRGVAVGHFNISNTEQLWGIFNAARSLELPIFIGTSEGERAFIGPRQAAVLVQSLREQFNWPIYLNADHTYSLEKAKEAVDVGYDCVIFDGAQLSMEENIAQTKEFVSYVRETRPEVLVEGELGYIGTSSSMMDELPEGAAVTREEMTSPEEAQRFVEETGVDLLAPAVGNVHGMMESGRNPNLDTERISALREAAGVPLVLHGGSGVSDEDFVSSIEAGMGMVHINTEIRVAFREALEQSLQEKPDEIAPYKYMDQAVDAVTESVANRLKLFNKLDS